MKPSILCFSRDLIKKFLVIDRARRLGNMKVSEDERTNACLFDLCLFASV